MHSDLGGDGQYLEQKTVSGNGPRVDIRVLVIVDDDRRTDRAPQFAE
jgi:hypothetical protein